VPEGVGDFGDLLENVTLVFRLVFVTVDLRRDVAGAVVFCFRNSFVGIFDLGRLVIGVVCVGRGVAVSVGRCLDVAISVVFVFGGVFEGVGDREGTALGISFDFGREFRGFAAGYVATRADRSDLL
jgi:hypothetical protein